MVPRITTLAKELAGTPQVSSKRLLYGTFAVDAILQHLPEFTNEQVLQAGRIALLMRLRS